MARLTGGLAVAAVAIVLSQVGLAGAAHAATPPDLFVDNTAVTCSDSGTGTQSRPYCTISAAVAVAQPGQTVQIGGGVYGEHVIVARSGAAGQPIVLRPTAQRGAVILLGPTAGITVDGQHDVTISGFEVSQSQLASIIDLRNSSRLTIDYDYARAADTAAVVGVRLTAVTDSSVTTAASGPQMVAGVVLDAATSGVQVGASTVEAAGPAGSTGIDVFGSHNTIAGAYVSDARTAAIALEPGAAGNVVAASHVYNNPGTGILNSGASGTAITNNTVENNCGTGIRVDGASSGVSVQNNVALNNGAPPTIECNPVVPGAVQIGVYDGGVTGGTIVDYNTTHPFIDGVPPYAWGTPKSTLAAFRTASGQAAHDIYSSDPRVNEDSANSAAPGFEVTGPYTGPREDDPAVPNTGAGPITYADRGFAEVTRGPSANVDLTPDFASRSVTVDASRSTPGFPPIATYAFDFGDGSGTLTQATPVAHHQYAHDGDFTVKVTVTDTVGAYSWNTAVVSFWPVLRTVALLSHANDRYVSVGPYGASPLDANTTAIGQGELFDLIDHGDGKVALRSRVNGRYVQVGYNAILWAAGQSQGIEPADLFQLINNPDGSISLLANSGQYVTAENAGSMPLVANRSAIGPWEQFNLVDAANAGIALTAQVNTRYVTAENAGSMPLIANRAAKGSWETFDLVDAGGGWVALYSHADGRFVTAENAGSQPLIANRTAIGTWEKFKVVTNADGTLSLVSFINGRYVTAENAGSQPLIANRTAIGLWEKFTRIG